jgi:hypothetical protein
MKKVKFNLNHRILVKLNDKGYKKLADYNNEIADLYPSIERRNPSYYKAMADKEGYSSFQMHDFMNKFGYVSLGFDLPFETNVLIEIDESELKQQQ